MSVDKHDEIQLLSASKGRMNQEDSLLDRLRAFFAENGTTERRHEKAECEKYGLICSPIMTTVSRITIASDILRAGKELEKGWRVEIKHRKGGNSAGTSDAVSVKNFNFLKFDFDQTMIYILFTPAVLLLPCRKAF